MQRALSYAHAARSAAGASGSTERPCRHEADGPHSMNLDLVQWPAMGVTVVASWLVASTREGRRKVGFWVFMLSNLLWIVWGLHAGAAALIALQLCLAAMNIRGAAKTDT
jgi:hypothetical protein